MCLSMHTYRYIHQTVAANMRRRSAFEQDWLNVKGFFSRQVFNSLMPEYFCMGRQNAGALNP